MASGRFSARDRWFAMIAVMLATSSMVLATPILPVVLGSAAGVGFVAREHRCAKPLLVQAVSGYDAIRSGLLPAVFMRRGGNPHGPEDPAGV